ncbi:MAG TPA: metallophosphoesterase family protein [Opitutaceae bacterium]|nr:metallophosphoesterase family protein [Opitutaceae bacterium]
MRVALLSDIHGNSVGFEAVLADIERAGGVDAYWILGDLVALGPDPVGVIDRLMTLENVHLVRGNTDRYVATGDRPPPTLADVQARPELKPQFIEVEQTFAWTHRAIAEAGRLSWLQALRLELRVILPDGTRFLGVHASPGRDDGDGISAGMSDPELESILRGAATDVLCTGHTHRPMLRKVGHSTVANLGAVSLSATSDKRSSYALLTATSAGYSVEPRLVDYDIERVIAMLEKRKHPGRAFIIRHLRTT